MGVLVTTARLPVVKVWLMVTAWPCARASRVAEWEMVPRRTSSPMGTLRTSWAVRPEMTS